MGKTSVRLSSAERRAGFRKPRPQHRSVVFEAPVVTEPAFVPDPPAVPTPFIPKTRRSGRAPPTGEKPGPKGGLSNAERRPTAVQLGTDFQTVPWSAGRFEDLTVVAEELAQAVKNAAPGRGQVMLQTLLRIASGEWPRPTYFEQTTRRRLTSVKTLAQMAGLSKFIVYDDIEVVAILDRWLPRLIDAPGYTVHVVNGKPTPAKPVQAKVLTALNNAEREGRLLPAAHNRGVSLIGFCEQNDLSIQEVRSSEGAVKLITDASKRPGAVGPKYEPFYQGAEYSADTELVLEWLQDLYRRHQPLPGYPDRPTIIDIEYIEQQAGIRGRSVEMAASVAAHIKMHRADFGVRPRQLITVVGPTCAEFKEAASSWFVAEHGSAGVHHAMTALNRVYSARDLSPTHAFPRQLFADLPRLQADAASVAPPLKSARNLKRPLEILADYGRRFTKGPDDGLPQSAHEALNFAIIRWGGKITKLEAATGIPATLLSLLRTGQQAIPQRYVNCLSALDEALGTGEGLFRRFEPDAVFRLRDCSQLYRSLSSKVRNLLPSGAHKLEDEELIPLVREVTDNAVRQNRMYNKVLAASQRFWRDIPNVPADAPFMEELRLLMRHKTMPVPDDARRRGNGLWSSGTRELLRRSLTKFGRFALLTRDQGGLGLSVEDVSLALLLNWRILVSYMEFLSRRYENIEHDGERRGSLLTMNDLGFLQHAASLLHSEYGWVQQRSDLFKPRVTTLPGRLGPYPGLEELRIRHSGDEEMETEELEELLSPQSRLFLETMPAAIVEAANDNWFEACIDARSKINNLRTYLTRFTDPSRSPFEPIQDILDSDSPLNFLRDIAQAAQDDLPDMTLDPIGHAMAVRNLLMFVLLSLTALRSKNLRQLIYDPVRGGQISVKDEHLFIKIPWEHFKNLGSWRLFGMDGFKFDYEREVADWFNVKALFEHYIRECRPLLVAHFRKRLERSAQISGLPHAELSFNTNALFPTTSLKFMTEHDFGDVVRDLTRRYHVIDPQTGLVRPGYMFFGPHAVRDIVAQHIIKASNDPGRWEEAADMLQTSVAMIQLRYTHRKVVLRLAKSDKHYDKASESFRKRAFA